MRSAVPSDNTQAYLKLIWLGQISHQISPFVKKLVLAHGLVGQQKPRCSTGVSFIFCRADLNLSQLVVALGMDLDQAALMGWD